MTTTLMIDPIEQTAIAVPVDDNVEPITRPALLWGNVINATTGYGVGGVKVIATGTVQTSTAPVQVQLGEAVTSMDGSWQISSLQSAATAITLKLMSVAGAVIPCTVREGQVRIGLQATVLAQVPARTISAAEWQLLGQRLADQRVAQVHTLAAGLLQLDGAAPLVPEWTFDQRQAALQALELSFLDPRSVLRTIAPVPSMMALRAPGGLEAYVRKVSVTQPGVAEALNELEAKVTAFGSLTEVDWVLDNEQFTRGEIAGAITKNQPSYPTFKGYW
jgi:hypothetical protein